ncbi:MAG: FHA domain-containing protein [Gammaproteobacteria bacterium]|nr:FHA domain-containing protein [Gammaproteobacteria bacterium]
MDDNRRRWRKPITAAAWSVAALLSLSSASSATPHAAAPSTRALPSHNDVTLTAQTETVIETLETLEPLEKTPDNEEADENKTLAIDKKLQLLFDSEEIESLVPVPTPTQVPATESPATESVDTPVPSPTPPPAPTLPAPPPVLAPTPTPEVSPPTLLPTPPPATPEPPPTTKTLTWVWPAWIWVVSAILVLGAGVGALAFGLHKRRNSMAVPVAPESALSTQPASTTSANHRQDVSRPRALLRDLSGSTGQKEHAIEASMVQLGRAVASQGTGVQSVVVQVRTVGRRHAMIEYRNHAYWLVDQGSMNGTYVDGQRVTGEIALRPGARVRLENAEFEFVLPDVEGVANTQIMDANEFLETLKASSPAELAALQTAAANRSVDANAQPNEDTAPVVDEDDTIAAGKMTGTVDFDVLGDAGGTPPKETKQSGLIDSYTNDAPTAPESSTTPQRTEGLINSRTSDAPAAPEPSATPKKTGGLINSFLDD